MHLRREARVSTSVQRRIVLTPELTASRSPGPRPGIELSPELADIRLVTCDCSDVTRVRDPPRVYEMLDQISEPGRRLVMSNSRQLTQRGLSNARSCVSSRIHFRM